MSKKKGSKPQRRSTDVVINSILHKDTIVKGTITGDVNLRIEGKLIGNVNLNAIVIVSATGIVQGDIEANIVVIEGTIKGNIHAREKVEIRQSARLEGDVRSPAIMMSEGASFEGKVHSYGEQPPIQQIFVEKRGQNNISQEAIN